MKRILSVAAGLSLSISAPLLAGWQPATTEKPAQTAPAAAKAEKTERWYVLMMQGQRAGYLQSIETTEGGKITSSSDMHMEIKRGPLNIKVLMQSAFVETADGKPVSMSTSQALARWQRRR
ncbi:MAG: hypothetical protein QM783_13915 [Phycisphaerales bacterium]